MVAEGLSGAARRAALRRNLRSSLVDGTAFSIMVGCGETYFAAFALALGLSQVASGLVATLPLLAGSVLQLASPFLLRRFGSYRRWIVCSVLCQAAIFLPMAYMAVDRRIPAELVFVFAAIYWGAGLATGPAWNTWIGTLVPVTIRARFFAWRTRLVQLGTLLGFVGGGVALQYGAGRDATLLAFAFLFMAAGLARLISGLALARQSEPVPPGANERHVSLGEFATRIYRRADGRFLLYLMAVQAAVQFSGPYFTPFMIKQLKLSYVDYMTLVASAFAAKMFALPWIGQLAHRYGPRKLLIWGSIGIMPLSALWLVSNNYWFLLALQIGGGFGWAAYELAWFLLFFEMLPKEERTSVLTTFNFGHSLASVVGSLLGGTVLLSLGAERPVYLGIFVGSAVLRLLVFATLRPRFTASPRAGFHRPARPTHSIDIAASQPHAPQTNGAPLATNSGTQAEAPARDLGAR
ncbi:MAG: MFS transporter [Planctomycetales bacterium]|nr:MFS transporter [Planctomycetales bacterium]